MWKKTLEMRYVILVTMLLTVVMVCYGAIRFHSNNMTVSNTRPIAMEGFRIRFEDGSCKNVELPENITAPAGEKIVLLNVLTREMENQTLAFRTSNCRVAVRVDGGLIYEYGQDESGDFVKSPGYLWHFVQLPAAFETGSLEIEMASPYRNLGGMVNQVVWGARSSCILNFMYSEWVHVIIGFSLLIVGLVFLVFHYVLGHLNMQNSGLFHFALGTILFAIHLITLSGMLQVFYGNAMVYYLVGYCTLYLCFVPFVLFMADTMFVQYGGQLRVAAAIYLGIYVVLMLLQWFGVADLALFANGAWVVNMLFLASFVVMVGFKVRGKSAATIDVVVGLLSLMEIAFVFTDYFVGGVRKLGLRHYGMIVLALVPACYYIYRSVHLYQQELDEKLQLNNQAMKTLTESQAKLSRRVEGLEQERDSAVKINRMKSTFLGNVAEKLLMPMSRIIGMNDLILRDEISEGARELAGNVQSESSIMLTLIHNIMDYSRVEDGRLEIKPVAYQVENLIYDMCELVSIGIIDKKIDFVVDVSPNLPRELLGDELRIRQILTNILNNAIHHTDSGTIRFKVESVLTDADEVMLTIVVTDTGSGMDETKLKGIFENYLLYEGANLSGTKGTGLGLAVCKKLVELMQGSIQAQSQVGEGSTFTITLPQKIINGMPLVEPDMLQYKVVIFETNHLQRMILKKTCKDMEVDADFAVDENEFRALLEQNVYRTAIICEAEFERQSEYLKREEFAVMRVVVITDVAGSVNTYENAEILQRPVQCMNLYDAIAGNDLAKPIEVNHVQKFIAPQANVLIVDDNPSNVKICMAMLEPYKMQLTTSFSGRDCLEILLEKPVFDLVFLDYMMPELSGAELIGTIRGMEEKYYKTLPIIAMTARQINGAKEAFVAEGFDHYVDKPFEASQLEKILEAYLPEEKMLYGENPSEGNGKDEEE